MMKNKLMTIYQFKDIENMYNDNPLLELQYFTTYFYGSSKSYSDINTKYHQEYYFQLGEDSTIYEDFIKWFIVYFKAYYKYSYYINEDKFKDKFNTIMLKWYDLYLFKYVKLKEYISEVMDGSKDVYASESSREDNRKAYQNQTPQNEFSSDFLDDDFINAYQKALDNSNGTTSSSTEHKDNISEQINYLIRSIGNLYYEMVKRFISMFIEVNEDMIIEEA